jgi:hypothetical protein
MRKLTIDGKPVVVWFEKRQDMVMAISKYCLSKYVWTKDIEAVAKLSAVDHVPMIECPIEQLERVLKLGYPVLICIQQRKDKYGIERNPLLNRIQGWRYQYPGLVAFGSRKDECWRILEEHAESFDLLGYS